MSDEKIELRVGDTFELKGCGTVKFERYDYYMGQKTIQAWSEKYRQTYNPLPEKVESQGYTLID